MGIAVRVQGLGDTQYLGIAVYGSGFRGNLISGDCGLWFRVSGIICGECGSWFRQGSGDI